MECKRLGYKLALICCLTGACGHAMAAKTIQYKKCTKSTWQKINLRPYLGLQYDYMHIKARSDWRTTMPANYNDGGAFIGTKLFKYFGLEVGYYKSLKWSQDQNVLTEFDDVANNGITGTTARAQYKGFKFDANFLIPLDPKFFLNLVVGAQTFHPSLTITATGTSNLANAMNVIKGRNYTALRLGGGFEYVETHWGARTRVLWINTRNMTLNLNNAQDFFPTITKYAFNQTLSVDLGVFFIF